VESKGFKFLFIPPYSPQYNPIKEVFSDLKRVFRRSLMASNRKFDLAISDSINYIKENQLGIVQHYVSTYKKCNE
jgi:transposase